MPIVAKDLMPAHPQLPDTPCAFAAAVTPDDVNELGNVTRALYVGVTGDVTVVMAGKGTAVLFKAMPVGLYVMRVRQVKAGGTTATNLVALW